MHAKHPYIMRVGARKGEGRQGIFTLMGKKTAFRNVWTHEKYRAKTCIHKKKEKPEWFWIGEQILYITKPGYG